MNEWNKENIKMGKMKDGLYYISTKTEYGTWQTNWLTEEDLKTIIIYLGSGFDKLNNQSTP